MTRIVQYLVDAAVIYVLALIAGFALGISGAVGAAFAYLVGSAILFGYFWLADSTGGTIGRRLMGLKLVDDEGNAPTPDMVLIRSLMFVISLMIPILQLPFLFKLTLSPFTIESGCLRLVKVCMISQVQHLLCDRLSDPAQLALVLSVNRHRPVCPALSQQFARLVSRRVEP